MSGAESSPSSESVAGYLARARLLEEEAELVRLLVEGYHAAPLEEVSARVIAEDAATARGSSSNFERRAATITCSRRSSTS